MNSPKFKVLDGVTAVNIICKSSELFEDLSDDECMDVLKIQAMTVFQKISKRHANKPEEGIAVNMLHDIEFMIREYIDWKQGNGF